MLEARHFIVFIDHKPITYAFQQKQEKCSSRQLNHLDFVSQFTADKRHIPGHANIVANSLSLVESVTAPPSYDARQRRAASKTPGVNNCPAAEFTQPAASFIRVHVDRLGPLPTPACYTYCLSAVDRLTRSPEVIPLPDSRADTMARALLTGRISRLVAAEYHHRPEPSVRVATLSIPGKPMWNTAVWDDRPPSGSQCARRTLPPDIESSQHVPRGTTAV
jgi:hypothetical protein